MTPVRSTPRWLSRLSSLLLILALLSAFVVPAFAQEGVSPAPPAAEEIAASTVPTVKTDELPKGAVPEAAPAAPNDAGAITNYAFSASGGTFTPLASATRVTAVEADDASSGAIPLGFTFWYMGVPYTRVYANSNGFLSFNSSAPAATTVDMRANNLTSSVAGLRPLVAPLWDDLEGSNATSGSVASYLTSGSGPNRIFTFEWLNWEWGWQANAAVISFQAKLYEADGHIEFVYRQDAAAVNTGSASIGMAATATGSGNFLSLNGTGTSPTASSTSETTSLSTKPATGQVYAFTPPPAAPAAPSGLNFTAVAQTGMTLNWTDNATGEAGYAILRSTDGITYVFAGSAAADAISYAATGLNFGTLYYWQVYAVSEGAASTALAGSQATNPAGEISCNGAGGLWSSAATWSGGILPTATDNVTINNGCTVTIDTAATINNLTVGTGTSGILQYETTTARTLTVNDSVTIASGGIFQSATTGTVTTHLLSVGTNFVNNGTLDFSTNTNTAGAELRFVNATNNTISGTGTTTDLRLLSLSKGSGTITTSSPVLEITIPFTVRGAASDTAGFLNTATFNGILKISGTFTYSSVVFQAAAYSIPSTGGFWLNNANFTVSGLNGSPTMNGLLRVANGTYTVGTGSGNTMGAGAGAIFLIEGGTVNVTGRLNTASAVSYTQSGGTVNVPTVANASASTPSFGLTSTSATFTMSGGVINLVQINSTATATSRLDYQVSAIANITGGTLNVGTSATTGNTGNFDFRIRGQVPALVIDNTTNAKNALAVAQTNIWRNMTVNTGTKLDANGFTVLMLGSAATNNGSIVGTVALSRLDFQGTSAQTYVGSGTFGTAAAPFLSVGIFNGSGVTLSAPIVTNRVNLFWGTFANSNQFTLGNGGASSTFVQIGQTGATTPGGNFDVSPTYSTGSGGHTTLYAQETVARTTGFEIPGTRSVASVTINNTNGVTLAGGGLTITGATGLTLTAGLFNTSAANTPKLATTVTTIPTGSATSYVNGPLAVDLNSAANVNRTFAIGNSTGWRPVVISNFHSNGALQTYTAEVINGPTGGTPVSPLVALTLARYVRIQNTANIFSTTTANVQLSYGADDNVGTLATARVAQANTASGSYTSRGGATAASPTTGINSTTAINPGDDYFVLANEQSLPVTWDGGASTSNWGDANNWNPDGVPTGTSNVNLASGGATTINVNGPYAVNNLTLANSITLNLGSNTLTLNGAFSQSGGVIDLGSGTLEVKGDFAKTGGTFTPNTGTVLLSGTAVQAINCTGVTFYNLNLQNGGAGNAKTFTAGVTCTINNDFTVGSTAQMALGAATATTFNVGGNLNYGGVAGGANIGSLTIILTGVGKAIGGAALEAPAQVQAPEYSRTPVQEVSFLTDASRFATKEAVQLENTYAQRQADVDRLLAAKSPDSLLIVTLDDRTIVQNPAWMATLAPAAAPSFEMNVTVASGASYTMQDNLTMGTGRTLTLNGQLNTGTYTISGAGALSVASTGILGTAQAASGVGATVLTTGANTYTDGSIVEYNAAGNQTIDAASHPATSMMQTGGSGTKTLNGNKSISGSSGSTPTKGMIYVKAGTTFADGGYTISGTSTGYDNVVVYGNYLSTGAGAISFESGPTVSKILAVNAVVFGDLKINFSSSTSNIYLQADTSSATSNVTFRNITFGGTAGTGTAGGTLTVNYVGTTPVIVTGNVSLSPVTASNTGGGFGGTASTVGTVTVKGNIASTSAAATQPIFNNTGTNTLIMAGTSPQTIDIFNNTAILTGVPLQVANGADVSLVPTSGVGRVYRLGGNLTVDAGGAFRLGQNTLFVEGTVTNNGKLAQTLAGPLSGANPFLTIQNYALSATKYYGLELTPTSPPFTGDTTVTIAGNQQCPQVTNTTVKRCYEVTPASAQPANIKFYFSEPEMTPTGQPLANQNVWNYHTSAWNAVTRGSDSVTCNAGAINCFVEGTGIATYSPFAVSPTVPLAVTLASFGAQGGVDRIVVTWETLSEANNAGFNIYRADDAAGPQTLLAYVPSQGPGSTQGFAYTYDDLAVQAGHTYWYWLEDVSLNGATTLHGPVSATVSAPTAVTLASLQATPASAAIPSAAAALAGLAGLAAAGVAISRRRAR